MAVSKITYKSSPSATPEVWFDVTGATATAADIISPKTAMLANGVVTEGTGSGGDIYDGSYTVDPTFNSQTIPTKDKTMADDISVSAIEVNSVSNPFGGNTVYIGG